MLEFIKKLFHFSSMNISFFGRTDTGMVRKKNEDSFCILADKQIFLVADGMGGHRGGEVASRVAIESLVHFMSDKIMKRMKGNVQETQHVLLSGFRHCNKSVMDQAANDANLQGMGCTLIACIIDKSTASICHVGDVRCYFASGQNLSQLTHDHTLLAEQHTESFAETAISRSVVSRAIGFPFYEDPEFHTFSIKKGDKILLCSDGLWSMVDDEEMKKIIFESSTPEKACDTLVHRANECGGKDNITALTIFC